LIKTRLVNSHELRLRLERDRFDLPFPPGIPGEARLAESPEFFRKDDLAIRPKVANGDRLDDVDQEITFYAEPRVIGIN
jgi:hypothetical protein